MANLIDKLTAKVDLVRQKAANKFGLPSFDVYRCIRTWSNGEIGNGTPSDALTLITPTPKVVFSGEYGLNDNGLDDDRKAKVSEISLTYTQTFLNGQPTAAGVEVLYKLVERNGQGQATSYWVLVAPPQTNRDEICWELSLANYTTLD